MHIGPISKNAFDDLEILTAPSVMPLACPLLVLASADMVVSIPGVGLRTRAMARASGMVPGATTQMQSLESICWEFICSTTVTVDGQSY